MNLPTDEPDARTSVKVTPNKTKATPQKAQSQAIKPNQAMTAYMTALLGAWELTPSIGEQAIYTVTAPALSSTATRATPDANPILPAAPLKVGELLLGISTLLLNSDHSNKIIQAQVIAPYKYAGSTLTGAYQRSGEGLILAFNRYNDKEGRSYSITAYAIDKDTSEAQVASNVETHDFQRWGCLIASSFLRGAETLGSAIPGTGTTNITTQDGLTVVDQNSQYDTEEQVLIALGGAAGKGAEILEKNIDRPPTVTLNSMAEIGIIVMSSISNNGANQ
jgi:hypothetical protein